MLTTAWDGGQCGPIQDQLRDLVAAKITAAQQQIADLMTFTAELQQASAALERHRPSGACDADCGCVTSPDTTAAIATTIQPIALSTKTAKTADPPIACTLSPGSITGRISDWNSLLANVERREPVDGGIRCVLNSSVPTEELFRVVAAEQDCCQFFQFAITVDTRGIALEVRAPLDAQLIIESMFGTPS